MVIGKQIKKRCGVGERMKLHVTFVLTYLFSDIYSII